MAISIELPLELEQQVRSEAARCGVAASDYIVRAVAQHVERDRPGADRLSRSEADLLQRINFGLPSETWIEYRALIARRQSGTLTSDEQARLIAISDRIEKANVLRMEALIELARQRGTNLEALMDALRIHAPPARSRP